MRCYPDRVTTEHLLSSGKLDRYQWADILDLSEQQAGPQQQLGTYSMDRVRVDVLNDG
jgi:hypothetical protein